MKDTINYANVKRKTLNLETNVRTFNLSPCPITASETITLHDMTAYIPPQVWAAHNIHRQFVGKIKNMQLSSVTQVLKHCQRRMMDNSSGLHMFRWTYRHVQAYDENRNAPTAMSGTKYGVEVSKTQ